MRPRGAGIRRRIGGAGLANSLASAVGGATCSLLEYQPCGVIRRQRLQKTHPDPATERPGGLCRQAISGEQLHDHVVSRPNPEAALQLQAACGEIDDPHGLKPAMTMGQRGQADRMAFVAPPNRWTLFMS